MQTLIGAAVAIVVNMLIAPPDYTNTAAVSFKKAVELLSQHYSHLSEWIENGGKTDEGQQLSQSARQLSEHVANAAKEVEQAMKALKFSPSIRRRRPRLEYFCRHLNVLKISHIHSMELQRLLIENIENNTLDDEARKEWCRIFIQLAHLIEDWGDKALKGEEHLELKQLIDQTKLPPLNENSYSHALIVEAHQLLDDLTEVNTLIDDMTSETKEIFGEISDGKGKISDLFNS